jgi:hypothetical protein
METTSLADFKESVRRQGFEHKAVVTDEEMERARKLFESQEGVLDTPPDELRYMEGLLDLPYGYVEQFKILPQRGHERCACGRTPSALDVVSTALRRKVHDKALIRDTLIGFSNVIELSEDGRAAECFNCGRTLISRSYWTRKYMYA